jgi:hypothetical protein
VSVDPGPLPVPLRRFLELLYDHGEARMFTLDGAPCRFVRCSSEYYVTLSNRHGAEFEIAGGALVGHFFNEWRL